LTAADASINASMAANTPALEAAHPVGTASSGAAGSPHPN
jgi:hypothetical protein